MAMLVGIVVSYVIGLPYLYIILNFYMGGSVSVMGVLAAGFFPFIALDLVKGIVAAFLARAVSSRLRGLGTQQG
jgi:biotin transport system substrate-specific component